ncbi:MAG: NUDIX domain-containing protein [Nanoarchaeota archaeon]
MDNKHYIMVTGIIIKDGKYLITKRPLTKKAFPGKWTVPGGNLEVSDYIDLPKDTKDHWYNIFEKVLRREVQEEVGLDVSNIKYLTSMTFLKGEDPCLIVSLYTNWDNGEVVLNEESVDYAWVDLGEAENYDLIEGIYEELVMLDKILKGEKVGEWAKKEVKKKIGAGVGVILLRNGKILLGKRHEDPTKADSALHGSGTWTMPGGKLDFHEKFEECGIREVKEETGINVTKLKVICFNNDTTETAHFITAGLLVEEFEGDPKVMEPDEITEWKWFDLNNLPEKIYFPSGKVLRNYLANKFYIGNN